MLKEIVDRRSCRKFDKTKEVKKEDLDKVIAAGLLAPSGMNKQEGIVICITNKEKRDALSRINKGGGSWPPGDPFYDAPVILLVAVKKSFLADDDGAVMIQNMLLEATHLGLACCWIHRAKEELENPEFRELFKETGLNYDEYQGVGHVALGYNDGYVPGPKVIKDNRVFYIK